MVRFFVGLFLFFMVLPASAVTSEDKVFLYLTSPKCSYCQKFNPSYLKIMRMYAGKYQFVKADIATTEGRKLMKDYSLGQVQYVPYVAIFDNRILNQIDPECLMDFACLDSVVSYFAK